jgi:hypothetical protein
MESRWKPTTGKVTDRKGEITMEIRDIKRGTFKKLYDGSALTFEGLDISGENLNDLYEFLEKNGLFKRECYVISGKEMNKHYHLTDSNAYPDDLTIVCVELSNFDSITKITMARFELGGRWFDDVVDNNRRRQREINKMK